jgi:hypothetical protein
MSMPPDVFDQALPGDSRLDSLSVHLAVVWKVT